MCTILADLHEKGCYHGNLNSRNIHLTEFDWLILSSFPLIISHPDQESFLMTVDDLKFMAPEIVNGASNIDYQMADLYSLGKLLLLIFGNNSNNKVHKAIQNLISENAKERSSVRSVLETL